jgi:hypothetical protein
VAVIDTGLAWQSGAPIHPQLNGRIVPGWNFILNNNNFDNRLPDNSSDQPAQGHGTAIAGLIVGAARELRGFEPGE